MTAQKGDIYLGTLGSEELLSPFGRKLIITPTELSREERTASGRLVKDIIATKHRFTLAYECITGTALEQFLDFYAVGGEMSLLIFTDSNSTTTTPEPEENYDNYTVLMEPIERERLLLLDDGLWSGVNIILNEV
jgi:hypothetical protein